MTRASKAAPGSNSARASGTNSGRAFTSASGSISGSASGSASGTNVAEYSVSDLSSAIKGTIERGFGHVRLRGEVSGYRGPHSSGHCYFGLKDDKAKIDAIVWRGVFSKLRFKPEEGMEVIATGKVTTYPGGSKYQIVIEALEPAGAGALMALLEERKKMFAAEGLFAEDRKKRLPFLPRTVGIITSPTGAVIRDMLHGFNERFPAHVLLWPVRVQGETSGDEVAAAVRGFNALSPTPAAGEFRRPDVLIVARGGGSLEDLWGFNDEAVVRAVADSSIPVISAVGHETDWTLVDLVADARAPTPTKAAEWAVPKYSDLLEGNAQLSQRLRIAMRRQLENATTHLRAAARGLPRLEDLLAMPRQRFDTADRRLGLALVANTRQHAMRLTRTASPLRPQMLRDRLSRSGERLDVLSQRAGRAFVNCTQAQRRRLDTASQLLRSLSYQSVLHRGFALVRSEDGAMLRSASTASNAARLDLEFADGHMAAIPAGEGGGAKRSPATSNDDRDADATPAAKPKAPRGVRLPKTPKAKTSGQGSLF